MNLRFSFNNFQFNIIQQMTQSPHLQNGEASVLWDSEKWVIEVKSLEQYLAYSKCSVNLLLLTLLLLLIADERWNLETVKHLT